MTAFILIAGALALLVAVALAWPLRKTSPRLFAAMVVVVPALAVCLYRIVGTPDGLSAPTHTQPQTMAEAIAGLEADLKRDPRQVDGWRLLGRAHAEEGRADKARDAFARAAALAPGNDDVQVEYIESRALADPRKRFDADAVARLQRVLERNPAHQRARWFLGIAQRQAGDDAAAARTWEPLLTQVDASTAASLRPQIDAAREAAGLPPLPAAAAAPTSPHALTVKVALDPDFAARVRLRGDASVFVIARVPNGPPMPVAVEKRTLQELPLDVVLDDGDSPMPTRKLSTLKEVEVVARLSASGDAMRQEGDLESAPVRVTLPAKGPVELVIGAAR
jgi:cytochrome c-type biogenesis protein CcmH